MKNKLVANEAVRFRVNAREIEGILVHPDSAAPYPAIVLLHGSDRGSMNDPYYREHAENLVRSGLAVLRYDGTGWGGGDSKDSGFETLEYRTEEAIAAVQYLQSRLDVNARAVGLWGISQGGWICQMAAASYEGIAFIVPVSGPAVTPAEQEVYRVEAESREAGFDDDEIAREVLMRRLMVDIVSDDPMYRDVNLSESSRLGNGPWSEMTELTYSPHPVDPVAEHGKAVEILKSIQGERWAKFLFLDQILAMFENLPPRAWGMAKDQMRAVMEVDPAQYLTKVHCPVLAIFGGKDTSVPVEKSIILYKQYLGKAGNDAFTFKVFANADYMIRVGGIFADGYFGLMVNWLKGLPIL